MTIHHDDKEQWRKFGENGNGFAIGFWVDYLYDTLLQMAQEHESYWYWRPVEYSVERIAIALKELIVESETQLKTHIYTHGLHEIRHTQMRNAFQLWIASWLYVMMHMFKNPELSPEREIRFMFCPVSSRSLSNDSLFFRNDGVPFLFLDLRNSQTKKMPIGEIVFGPNTSRPSDVNRVGDLLDELGYSTREMMIPSPNSKFSTQIRRLRPEFRFSDVGSWE